MGGLGGVEGEGHLCGVRDGRMRHIFARVLPLPLWASLEPHRTQQTCTQLQTLELVADA